MGREIRRVPLDFDWPMNMPWKGFVSPYHAQKCQACDQSGLNPETKKISDSFYDGEKWRTKLTQEDVDHLQENNRLQRWNHDEKMWEKRPGLTAEMVNQGQSGSPFGNLYLDGCSKFILVKFRAEKAGVYGVCKYCGGSGGVWPDEEVKQLAEDWECTMPPEGEGWQLWETVSEGSPISPVFPTKEGLVAWIVAEENVSQKAAESFVNGPGFVLSMMIQDGKCYKGIEAAGVMLEP